jgi:hypothetical protein
MALIDRLDALDRRFGVKKYEFAARPPGRLYLLRLPLSLGVILLVQAPFHRATWAAYLSIGLILLVVAIPCERVVGRWRRTNRKLRR